MEVACLGLLQQKFLAWGCSLRGYGFLNGPIEVSGLGLVPQQRLPYNCSCGGCCQACSGRFPQMSLAWDCSHRGPWLAPSPTKVSNMVFLSWKSLTHCRSCRGLWLRPARLYLLLWRSLPWACSGWGCWLRPIRTFWFLHVFNNVPQKFVKTN